MRLFPLGVLLVSFAALTACGKKETPKVDAKKAEAAISCDLTLDTLAGRSFVRSMKGPSGKWEDDLLARATFYKAGDVLKMKYNVRSRADFYDYTCLPNKANPEAIECLEDNPKAGDWCRTLFANGKLAADGGACDVDELVRITGLTQADAQKARDEVDAEIKKFKAKKQDKEIEDMKKVFNSPNNQLRGIAHVKVRATADECHINLSDRFMTMTYGTVREMENVVGTARFNETKDKLVFEHCKDDDNLIALKNADGWGKPGETELKWKVNQQIPFRYVGNDMQKPEPGCTYTMDTWSAYKPITLGAPVQVDSKGRLNWAFTRQFNEAGKYIVHMYRYKACNGGEPKRETISCQGAIIE